MKKFFIAISMLAIGSSVFAQDGFKGKTFIMGQVGYGTTNDGDVQNYNIVPALGHFVSGDFAIGLALGYSGQTDKTGEYKINNNTFLIQPMVRKYWGVTNNFYIFGQAAVPIGFLNSKVDIPGAERAKATAYGLEIAPGIDYFLSPNWSIEASFGIASWNAVKPKNGDAQNDFNFGLDSGLINGVKFGIKYVF